MKRTLSYLIVLSLFSFMKVNVNAQEIFDFNYFSSDEVIVEHTFRIINTGSSGSTYYPDSHTNSLGIIHHPNGIAPYNVNKEMLLDALQYNTCNFNGFCVTIPESFQYYDLVSSTYKSLEFLGNEYSDGIIEPDEELNGKEYIFCWISNGRLWYGLTTINGYIDVIKKDGKIHFHVDFLFDVCNNPYGIWYYDYDN